MISKTRRKKLYFRIVYMPAFTRKMHKLIFFLSIQSNVLLLHCFLYNLFRICYKMCTQKSPYNWSDKLYSRHGETLSAYLQNKVLPALNSGAGSLDSEQLLEEFVKRGSNHGVMNTWYRKFFMYLVSSPPVDMNHEMAVTHFTHLFCRIATT